MKRVKVVGITVCGRQKKGWREVHAKKLEATRTNADVDHDV